MSWILCSLRKKTRFRCRSKKLYASLILISMGIFGILLIQGEKNRGIIYVIKQLESHADVSGTSCFAQPDRILRNNNGKRTLVTAMNTCSACQRPLTNLTTHKFSHPAGTTSTWQRYEIPNNLIVIVYSAFYDDRPAVGVTPWIRILGITANLNSRNITLYCQLWFEGCRTPAVVEAVIDLAYKENGYIIDDIRFIQKMFSCRLPSNEPVPSHVSLVAVDPCDNSTIYLPVERPIRSEPEHEFGICVAIAFGHVPVAEFVEWIELNRLLGVTEFNVYDAGMVNMSAVFEYYTRQGLLKVHHMPPPVPLRSVDSASMTTIELARLDRGRASIRLASIASLNDCQLRNMYRYRYIVVIDFDEFIVPLVHSNLSQMIEHSKKSDPLTAVHAFRFHNTYFFEEFKTDETQPVYLRTARYQRRIPPSPYGFGMKSIVNPRLCLVAYNHFCIRLFRDSPFVAVENKPRSDQFVVSPDVARSHHYRSCRSAFNVEKCANYSKNQTADSGMLRFKDKLQPAVQLALRHLDYPVT